MFWIELLVLVSLFATAWVFYRCGKRDGYREGYRAGVWTSVRTNQPQR